MPLETVSSAPGPRSLLGSAEPLRSKMIRLGPRALDPSELLAVLLGIGGESPGLGSPLRSLQEGYESLERLARAAHVDLLQIRGMTPRRTEVLVSAFELGRRVAEEDREDLPLLRSGQAVYDCVRGELEALDIEVFEVLSLDVKNRLRKRDRISVGTLTGSLVHPREVYNSAISVRAASIVVVHNHPSGDPEPSSEDLAITRRLASAGEILGVRLLDHVIVGQGRYVSLAELGLIRSSVAQASGEP